LRASWNVTVCASSPALDFISVYVNINNFLCGYIGCPKHILSIIEKGRASFIRRKGRRVCFNRQFLSVQVPLFLRVFFLCLLGFNDELIALYHF